MRSFAGGVRDSGSRGVPLLRRAMMRLWLPQDDERATGGPCASIVLPSPRIDMDADDELIFALLNPETGPRIDFSAFSVHRGAESVALEDFPVRRFRESEGDPAAYLFKPDRPGTYFYHIDSEDPQDAGLCGVIVVYPSRSALGPRWSLSGGNRHYAVDDTGTHFDLEQVLLFTDAHLRSGEGHDSLVSHLVNGRAFPDTLLPATVPGALAADGYDIADGYDTLMRLDLAAMPEGSSYRVLLRIVNASDEPAPFHLGRMRGVQVTGGRHAEENDDIITIGPKDSCDLLCCLDWTAKDSTEMAARLRRGIPSQSRAAHHAASRTARRVLRGAASAVFDSWSAFVSANLDSSDSGHGELHPATVIDVLGDERDYQLARHGACQGLRLLLTAIRPSLTEDQQGGLLGRFRSWRNRLFGASRARAQSRRNRARRRSRGLMAPETPEAAEVPPTGEAAPAEEALALCHSQEPAINKYVIFKLPCRAGDFLATRLAQAIRRELEGGCDRGPGRDRCARDLLNVVFTSDLSLNGVRWMPWWLVTRLFGVQRCGRARGKPKRGHNT